MLWVIAAFCCAGKGIKKCNKMLRNPSGVLLGALKIVMQSSLDSPEDWDFYFFLMKKIGSRFLAKHPFLVSGQLSLLSGILHNYFTDFL